MSDSYLLAVASACWLGILTSISPCPLVTNIVAMTYIGKKIDRPWYVVVTGLLYTLGRMITYVVIGVLIVASVMAIPDLSFFLQQHMHKILGPVLLLVGIFLLGAFRLNIAGPSFSQKLQGKAERYGLWGAVLLGLMFALSFCPVSAALFFGSLIPIAIEHQSSILMPTVYGIGTALPVVAFALLIAMGTRFVGKAFDKLILFEKWARKITGAIFTLAGIYIICVYIFKVNLF